MAALLLKVSGGVSRCVNLSPKVPCVAALYSKREKSAKALTYEQAVLNIPETRVTTLSNGVRVASENTGITTSTVGVYVESGSRYETAQNNGVAHFAEHLIFKGTKSRTKKDIESQVENLGAQLSNYTGRENSAFYAKCFSKDVPKLVELLADVTQNSVFPEEEVEKARADILQELEDTQNFNLQRVVLDHLHSIAFQGTSLGQSIFGPTENIRSITGNDLRNYISNNFKGPRIVLAAAGGVNHDELVRLAEQHFGKVSVDYSGEVPIIEQARYTGSELRVRDDLMPLAHVAVAVEGSSWHNPDSLALWVASYVIGSWDRTYGGGLNLANQLSRHTVELDLATSFRSFNISYSDTGLWGISFTSDRMKIDEFIYNVQHEWMRLSNGVKESEVERAKNQLITDHIVGLEGSTPTSDDIGRSILNYGRRIPIDELELRLKAINSSKLREVCSKYIYDKCPVSVGVGPVEALTDYNRLRSGMYWLRM